MGQKYHWRPFSGRQQLPTLSCPLAFITRVKPLPIANSTVSPHFRTAPRFPAFENPPNLKDIHNITRSFDLIKHSFNYFKHMFNLHRRGQIRPRIHLEFNFRRFQIRFSEIKPNRGALGIAEAPLRVNLLLARGCSKSERAWAETSVWTLLVRWF